MTPKLLNLDPLILASNPRCTFAAWQRYGPAALAAMLTHPNPYAFTIPGFSNASVCSKLRDAVRGALAFGYSEPDVSVDALAKWWSETTIYIENDQTVLGPKRKHSTNPEHIGEASARNAIFTFDTLSAEETQAFALLLNNNRISGPITIRKPKHEPNLAELFNVDIVHLKDGRLQII